MSKELEIFDSIIDMLGSYCCIKETEPKSNDYTVDKFMGYPIEKLRNIFKAMDIIKEKGLHFLELSMMISDFSYVTYCLEIQRLSDFHSMIIGKAKSEKEYNLLKEVLNND